MVSKCANPKCSANFRFFHTGQLFRVEIPVGNQDAGKDNGMKKSMRRLEFFWLCDNCSNKMTVAFEKGVGISVRPKLAQFASAA